jgi:maleylpyruvate isomerase
MGDTLGTVAAVIDRDVTMAAAGHQRLLAALDELVATGELDVAAPSRLPGWTVGHVLAHVRQSGDGHARMLQAAERGEVGEQYPHGLDGRAADIESDAGLPPDEQVDRLRRSIWALERCWATSSWHGTGMAARGVVAIDDLPFLRMREVAIHHVDLDIGYELDDLPGDYLRLELRRMEMLWRARQPMGTTGLPPAALAAPPPQRLGWLMGRVAIEGLEPAGVF